MDEQQGMEERNTRLIELATVTAKSVPAVQQECLLHLLFGLSDSDGERFLSIATNASLPVGMRAEFLKEALAIRPSELGEWLSERVRNHHEPEISAIARLYLIELQKGSD